MVRLSLGRGPCQVEPLVEPLVKVWPLAEPLIEPLVLVEPGCWDPLRFPLQQVDLLNKTLVGPVRITVNDDHVEVVSVSLLHLPGALDDLLELLVVHLLVVLHLPPFKLDEGRRGHEDDVRHQVAVLQDSE